MACGTINIPFGIPSTGAKEYNLNSGRELFRCGLDCVKMYITNVSMEINNTTYTCQGIEGASPDGKFCLKSAQISKRNQGVVNWIAKEGANSTWETGSVLTCADFCGSDEESPMIYTHTEGNLSVRVTINISDVANEKDAMLNAAKAKFLADGDLSGEFSSMEWILSDLGTTASPTDWQGGSVTYQGFSTDKGSYDTARASFSWDNGRMEKSLGHIKYDDLCNNKEMTAVVNRLIALGG